MISGDALFTTQSLERPVRQSLPVTKSNQISLLSTSIQTQQYYYFVVLGNNDPNVALKKIMLIITFVKYWAWSKCQVEMRAGYINLQSNRLVLPICTTESVASSIDKKGKATKAELLTEIIRLREEINGKFLYIFCFSEFIYYLLG